MKLEIAAVVLVLLAHMAENQVVGHRSTEETDLIFSVLAVFLWFASLAFMVMGLVP